MRALARSVNDRDSTLVRVTYPPLYEGVVLCLDHLFQIGDTDFRHDEFSSDVVAFWGYRCSMCGVDPSPGRLCENERCRRPLHVQWPAVYCCNDCALDDA